MIDKYQHEGQGFNCDCKLCKKHNGWASMCPCKPCKEVWRKIIKSLKEAIIPLDRDGNVLDTWKDE